MLSPRGQSGLEATILASASTIWPRPQPRSFHLGLSLGLKHLASTWPRSRCLIMYCNRAFFGKNRVKFGNFVNFLGNNLKSYSYVVSHYLVLFHNYVLPSALASTSRNWPRPRPRPRPRTRRSGLGLEVLASFNITC